MTIYYVQPTIGSDAAAGTSWATSWLTLLHATATAVAGDEIRISNANADVITVTTTYTLANVRIVSCAGATDAYAAGAGVSSVTFGVDIAINGKGSTHGVNFAAATTGGAFVTLGATDLSHITCEDGVLSVPSTTASIIGFGAAGAALNAKITTRRCTFRFGAVGAYIENDARWESYDDVYADSGSIPTTLINAVTRNATDIRIHGGDLSTLTGTLMAGESVSPSTLWLMSCKLNAAVTPLGTISSAGGAEIYCVDCAFDTAGVLTGLLYYHANYYGSTTVSTAVYAAAGNTVDGANIVSWLVNGTAAATFGLPYASPWMAAYNSNIATAVTPRLECLRTDSATAYTDEQVWAEFAYRGTANSPALTFTWDRRAIIGTAANQGASALGAADWVGEGATPWFGKLEAPASFTPAEIGYLQARVFIGGNFALYVDPRIIGLA